MNQEDFRLLLERRIDLTRKVLDKKSDEYSTNVDKLHNFKKTAQMRGNITPSQALQGFMDKHLTAYFDMLDAPEKKFTREQLDERFGDIINYFILQEALFVEKL